MGHYLSEMDEDYQKRVRDNYDDYKRMKGDAMGISVEIKEFAEIMTNRMRSFDEQLGTNNFITNMKIGDALDSMNRTMIRINSLTDNRERTEVEKNANRIMTKTLAVDLANLAMVLWSKL